jgi:uncharacterized protein
LKKKFNHQWSRSGRRGLIVLVVLLLVSWGAWAFALEVPEKPTGRVSDETGTLKPNEIATLNQELEVFEKETSNQITVLLISSLEGENLEDFSIRLAEKWKIGQKGKNNGVILLIVKNDRKLRIEVGYGLEGVLPDALAGSIIRNEIAPLFKTGLFYEGIDAGVKAIMAATKGEYQALPKKGKGSSGGPWWAFIPFFVIFGFVIFSSFLGRKRRYYSGGSRGWNTGGIFFGSGTPWGGSGGGFSGGGGDFGGGGASGDW